MRRLLPITAIFALLAAGVWLWFGDPHTRRAPGNAPLLESSEGTGLRTSKPTHEPRVQCAAPALPTESKQAPPAEAGEAAQLPAFIDDDPVVACQPLWTPDLGAAIQRGQSRVEFELLDAKGQALEPGIEIGFELWRKLGKFTLQEGARLSATRGTLICDGVDQGGLEPGDYELTLYCGPYGQTKREFHVGRGEHRSERVELPNWRRIVTLCFTDTAGNALPYLSLPPRYNPPGVSATVVQRSQPNAILRDPPTPYRDGYGSGGGRYSTTRRVRPSAPGTLRFPTDGGRWYVRVFAGGSGEITLDLDEPMFGTTRWQVRGTFTEPEWDNYKIAFDVPADFVAQMEKREQRGAENPGNKSVREPPAAPREPDLYDVSTLAEGWQRLVVTLNAPFPVAPRLWFEANVGEEKDKNIGPQVKPMQYHEALGRWWIDLPPNSGVGLEIVSTWLLQPQCVHGEPIELGSQRIIEVSRTLDCASVQFARPAATMAALGVCTQGTLFGIATPAGSAPWQPDGTLRFYITKSALGKLAANSEGLVALFGGAPSNALGRANLTFKLSEEKRAELALGGTSVALNGCGLVLRAVGASLEGLPWVEGTVLDAEQDVASKRLRKHWKGSAEEMEECYTLLRSLATKDVDGSNPEVQRLDALLQKLEDPASREFMRREGTWYNTHMKLQSSEHGYLCSGEALVPGRHYVLYLWSNSRGELMPDKRIDFVATEGVTDLGAVLLPSYSD